MSRISGDKARSAIERKRRTAQRVKDRARRAASATKPAPAPAAPAPAAPAPAAKRAPRSKKAPAAE
jgi:hypothetical protein